MLRRVAHRTRTSTASTCTRRPAARRRRFTWSLWSATSDTRSPAATPAPWTKTATGRATAPSLGCGPNVAHRDKNLLLLPALVPGCTLTCRCHCRFKRWAFGAPASWHEQYRKHFSYLENKDWLYLDWNAGAALAGGGEHARGFYFDAGASLWGSGLGGASQTWFHKVFGERGVPFEGGLFLWEVTRQEPDRVFADIPPDVLPYYHW